MERGREKRHLQKREDRETEADKGGPPSTLSLPTRPSTGSSKMPDTIMSKEPSSNLESAMQMLIKTFHKYSGKEGDKYTLSRGELKELLVEELGSYLGNSKDNEAVEKVMNDLDANNDGEVDFTEFIILMGALTVACNDFFLEFKTDEKPKDGESAEKKD
ncbi:S100 calcium binding protein S [Scomber scombrus]|uniref:S100 calcium binding protein S n=2 Tax=Scomber scombrus TaxID=13677 RepID=A0AAV1MQQ2_SCOSC